MYIYIYVYTHTHSAVRRVLHCRQLHPQMYTSYICVYVKLVCVTCARDVGGNGVPVAVCVYIYIHMYIYIHIYICIYVYIYIYIMCMYIHIWYNICTHMIYIYVLKYVNVVLICVPCVHWQVLLTAQEFHSDSDVSTTFSLDCRYIYPYDIYVCIDVYKYCSDVCKLCTYAGYVGGGGVPVGPRRVDNFLS